MDPYGEKLNQMKGYIPFLNKMILKLERAGDPSKDTQLSKMKSLLAILNTRNKNIELHTLVQCEDVLHKLYEKVEGHPLYHSTSFPTPATGLPKKARPSPRSPSPQGIQENVGFGRGRNLVSPCSPTREEWTRGSTDHLNTRGRNQNPHNRGRGGTKYDPPRVFGHTDDGWKQNSNPHMIGYDMEPRVGSDRRPDSRNSSFTQRGQFRRSDIGPFPMDNSERNRQSDRHPSRNTPKPLMSLPQSSYMHETHRDNFNSNKHGRSSSWQPRDRDNFDDRECSTSRNFSREREHSPRGSYSKQVPRGPNHFQRPPDDPKPRDRYSRDSPFSSQSDNNQDGCFRGPGSISHQEKYDTGIRDRYSSEPEIKNSYHINNRGPEGRKSRDFSSGLSESGHQEQFRRRSINQKSDYHHHDERERFEEEYSGPSFFEDHPGAQRDFYHKSNFVKDRDHDRIDKKIFHPGGSVSPDRFRHNSKDSNPRTRHSISDLPPDNFDPHLDHNRQNNYYRRNREDGPGFRQRDPHERELMETTFQRHGSQERFFDRERPRIDHRDEFSNKRGPPSFEQREDFGDRDRFQSDYRDDYYDRDHSNPRYRENISSPEVFTPSQREYPRVRGPASKEPHPEVLEHEEDRCHNARYRKDGFRGQRSKEGCQDSGMRFNHPFRDNTRREDPNRSSEQSFPRQNFDRHPFRKSSERPSDLEDFDSSEMDYSDDSYPRDSRRRATENKVPQSNSRERFPGQNHSPKSSFDTEFSRRVSPKRSSPPGNPSNRFNENLHKKQGGRRVLLPLPDHPPDFFQDRNFNKRNDNPLPGSRPSSHSGSAERRQRTETQSSRPPPPESPPCLATPMSPKSDDGNNHDRSPAEENGPIVIPLERNFPPVKSTELISPASPTQDSQNEITPSSPSPMDRGAVPQSSTAFPQLIPTSPEKPYPMKSNQNVRFPVTGHAESSSSALSQPEVTHKAQQPPLGHATPKRTALLPLPRFQPPFNRLPSNELAKSCFVRPPLAAPEDLPAAGELNDQAGTSPQDWQRQGNTTLPLRNQLNPRYPPSFPRHPFVRPPGPPGKNFAPRQQVANPSQRPTTYGEYRKLRESFESRFQPPIPPVVRSPLHLGSPPSTLNDSSSQSTPEEVKDHVATAQPTLSMNSRDPRRHPSSRVTGSLPSTSGVESSSMSPVYSSIPTLGFGTFKIPKRRQSDSDLKSETSISSEFGSDSEPELRIAEHESDHHDSTDDEAVKTQLFKKITDVENPTESFEDVKPDINTLNFDLKVSKDSQSEEKVNQSEVKDEVETEPVTPTKALRGRGRGRGRLRGKLTSRRSSRFHHVDLESDPAKKPDSDEEAANLVIDESDEKPQNEELEAKFVPTQPSNRARGRGRRGRGRKGCQVRKRGSPSKNIELKTEDLNEEKINDNPPVKIELSEEDQNIFMISQDFEPGESTFTFQKPSQVTGAKTLAKPITSGLSSLFEKLKYLDEEKEDSCPDEPKDSIQQPFDNYCIMVESKQENEEVSVNLIPPARYDYLDEILQDIDIEVPQQPFPLVSTLSSLLLSNDSEVDEETCQAYVERDANIQLSHSEKESLRSQFASNLKDFSSLSVMLRHINLRQLFKCMVKEKCAFTSDDAVRFKNHLNERHGAMKNKLRHGWLKCCYCLRKLSSPTHLVSHVIKRHGSSKYQCSYCFFRDTTATGLMLHQKAYHKNEEFNYLQCKSLSFNSALDVDYEPPTTRIFSCQIKKCNYLTVSDVDLAKHLFIEHKKSDGSFADFTCTDCEISFDSVGRLALHCSLMHQHPPTGVVKHVERLDLNDTDFSSTESIVGSTVDSDEEDVEDKRGCEEAEKVTNNHSFSNLKDIDQGAEIDLGFSGRKLYRCGNKSCLYSAETATAFRDHAVTCIFSINSLSVDCFHCQKPFKHVPTLLDHLKNHGLKRYSCSLCSTYRAATAILIKSHLKVAHRVSNFKILPIISNKTNPDEDSFVCMPKNCLVKSKTKDTFSPDEISELPRNAILSYLIRCSLCDFATKVRMNLIKHLRLHVKNSTKIPVITPLNQPESEEGNLGFAKMTSLLDVDQEEEKARKPLSEEDHRKLPALIDEELRYVCRECGFLAIDEVLLGFHLETSHPELHGMYACPHCTSEVENSQAMEAEEAQFHYKCHGELLFKCGHCSYYHWQKRTAEEHVAKNHIGHKQYTRDVRAEYRNLVISKQNPPKPESEKKKHQPKEKKPPPPYEPYKCGLCDFSDKDLDGIKEHCRNVHNLQNRFKCCLCELTSDCKVDLEKHLSTAHEESGATLPLIRVYHIDPSSLTTSATEVIYDEIRLPIWRREMPGLRHIRGILFDDSSEDYFEDRGDGEGKTVSGVSGKSDEDSMAIDCVKCGLRKSSVKGLKMHILLVHLKSGKFKCTRCEFTSNLKPSILSHVKSMHPPTDQTEEYLERECDPKIYSQEFWKHNWNIPTIEERRELLLEGISGADEFKMDQKRKFGDIEGVRKEKKKTKLLQKKHFSAKKLNRQSSIESEEGVDVSMKLPLSAGMPEQGRKTKDTSIQEISPFENVVTYRCIFCAKRFQELEKVECHLQDFHPGRIVPSETTSDREAEVGYRALTRDQVVNLITTSSVGEHSTQAEFKCYYCEDVVGDIYQVQEHFSAEHDPSTFKVKRVQDGKRGIPGYLECQICGYLSPGFGRSGQKVHFHEEHPSETVVNASKYVSKTRQATVEHGLPATKFDAMKYQGMTIRCPRADCQFEAQTMPAMLSHFRKHTVTFKCGHCGKVNRSSAEFYQHSGMSHGNKIPDHVKDPEAEAEFEALRGLVEANLEKEYSGQRQEPVKRSFGNSEENFIPVKIPKMSSDFDVSERAKPTCSTDSGLDAWCNN